jgi:glycosyltransferase involved in cell wall biosynthesis
MQNYELSILIPSRNEEFLARTVEDILKHKRGKTEIIVGLDGKLSDPPVLDHPDVKILYYPESIGQRAITNQLCKLSKAKYIIKCDAHCIFDEGFDIKLMADMQDNWTVVPTMKNLHAFDWVCKKCGDRKYQGPTPTDCPKCDNKTDFERDICWIAKKAPNSTAYRVDTKLHFQYHGEWKKRQKGDLVESFSLQGSFFMMTRKKYWELNVCDEKHGSWGQQGCEVALATWLSGGKVIVNKKTFYAHLFRTQGGNFSFPYPQSGRGVQNARKYSQDLWLNNKHPKQIYSLSWLIEKFKPLPDWHDKSGTEILKRVNKAGEEFYKTHVKKEDPSPELAMESKALSKGIIYYTDNKLNLKIARAVQGQLKAVGLPIVSASLKPMPHFGDKNIHIKDPRGVLTMFKQILAALEASTADIIFHAEADCLYPKEHFDFTPPRKDICYYDLNVIKVCSTTGRTLKVDVCRQVSGLCAYRELLLEEYRKRVEVVERIGYHREMGYEPGTKNLRQGGFSDTEKEDWNSAVPILDIRHDNNMTRNRFRKDQFRNQKNTIGWIEGDYKEIKGWDLKILEKFVGK